MDSITQIVLGAACGEAALGKKIGNKALLFGALGGTIPDLDVFTSRWIYNNEIDILSAHRGFSHSIVFALLGAFIFGYLIYWVYNKGKRQGTTSRTDWIKLFFLSLVTHIFLDAYTPYGTQLFLPFTDYRVAFNNISVADPTYTVPFLICLIVLMFFKRSSKGRRLWIKLAVGISSAYLLFTIGNKFYINSVFKKSFDNQNIQYTRYSTQPTILNNILWYGIAETKTDYFVGFYSLLDASSTVGDFVRIPKQHYLADRDQKDIKSLAWFSNGYFSFEPIENSENIRYNDLRYMMMNTSEELQSVFSFEIFKDDHRLNLNYINRRPASWEEFREELRTVIKQLYTRIKEGASG